LGALLISGCQTTGSSSGSRSTGTDYAYFSGTRSRANVYVDPAPEVLNKVAILPFAAPTELVGKAVSEMFVTEILKVGRYTLVERGQIAKLLRESELALSGISEQDAVELGNMLGAEGVVIGTVDEYATVAIKGNTYPVAAVSLRLISCKSSRVVWSVDLAARAEKKGLAASIHGRAVVHEMVSGLYKTWWERDPPLKPANVAVSDMGLREVAVTWKPPKDNASMYHIERSSKPDGPFERIGQAPPYTGKYTDRGAVGSPLADATTYYYRITAVAPNGKETTADEVLESFTSPPPPPVKGLKAEQQQVRCVTLNWEASPTTSVSSYVILRGTGGEAPATWKTVSGRMTTKFVDGGREPGSLEDEMLYRYQVCAVNTVGAKSAPSEIVTAVTRGVPPVVQGVMANSGLPRRVDLSWQASADSKVSRYDVYRATSGGAPARIGSVSGIQTTTYSDRGKKEGFSFRKRKLPAQTGNLADGEQYSYAIKAVNIGGVAGPASADITATTKSPPATPSRIAVAPASGGLEILWAPVAGPAPARYLVECSQLKAGKYKTLTEVQHQDRTLSYIDPKAKPGRPVYYRVIAVDDDGLPSAPSESVKGMLPGP